MKACTTFKSLEFNIYPVLLRAVWGSLQNSEETTENSHILPSPHPYNLPYSLTPQNGTLVKINVVFIFSLSETVS